MMSDDETNDLRPVGRGKSRSTPPRTRLKDMILKALDEAGGVQYLVRQAEEEPARFMALVAKVLPLEVNTEHNVGKRLARALVWKPPV